MKSLSLLAGRTVMMDKKMFTNVANLDLCSLFASMEKTDFLVEWHKYFDKSAKDYRANAQSV